MVSKIKGTFTIISLLLILIIGIGMVSASQDFDSAISENSTDDIQNNEITVDGKYFDEIQDAINNVDDAGTVILKDKSYVDRAPTLGYTPISVNKSVTIIGVENRTELDAQYNYNLIEIVNASDVVIKNIKFVNTDGYRAVGIVDSNVTFINCIFEQNQGYQGVAINIFNMNRDVTTKIINCTFKDNIADSVGGAIMITQNEKAMQTIIENSYFYNNLATRGAGIYIGSDEQKTGNLKIKKCTFEYNSIIADEDYFEVAGCDIHTYFTENFDIEINGSRFVNEKVMGERKEVPADALVLVNGKNSISNCEFVNSTIYFNKTDSSFDNCIFTDSKIDAFYDSDSIPDYENSVLNINGCIADNSYFEFGSGQITDSTFIKSGILKDSSKALVIENSEFLSQSDVVVANKVSVLNCSFDNSKIYNFDVFDLSVVNSTFSSNIDLQGGAIDVRQEDSKKSTLTIANSKFFNNLARYWGGAVYASGNIDLKISDSLFVNNTSRNGGAVYAEVSSGSITNTIFDENKAVNCDNETFDYLNKTYVTTGVSLDNVLESYEDYYFHDLPEWVGEDKFPEYKYRFEVINDGPIKSVYYGSAVFAKNITLDNNFWGLNIDNKDELSVNRIVNPHATLPDSWANYKNGSYVLNNENPISMPSYVPQNPERNIANMTIVCEGTYYSHVNIYVKLIDAKTGRPLVNQEVLVLLSNGLFESVFTDENGTATYVASEDSGNYTVCAISEIPGYKNPIAYSNVVIKDLPLNVTVSKLSAYYDSGNKITFKVTDSLTGKPINAVSLKVTVILQNLRTFWLLTNSNGVANLYPANKIPAGKYIMEITPYDLSYTFTKIKKTVKISKAKTTVKAPKVTNKYKKSKYFKLSVKNSITKKAVANKKVKVKVYTGKKSKTYTIKTNAKGIAKLNTKSLKVGKHKVVISSGNSNYVMSAKSTIVIKR